MPVPTTDGAVIRRRLQKDEVYERLLAAVLDGSLPPGGRLRDHELEQRFGVSRTPVRMALTRLERLRVVSSSASRVVRVAEADPALVPQLTEMLAALLLVGWRRTVTEGTARRLRGAPVPGSDDDGRVGAGPRTEGGPSRDSSPGAAGDELRRAVAGCSVLVDGLVTPHGGLLAATTDLAWVPLQHQLRLCADRVRGAAVDRAVRGVDAALRDHDEEAGATALLELGAARLLSGAGAGAGPGAGAGARPGAGAGPGAGARPGAGASWGTGRPGAGR